MRILVTGAAGFIGFHLATRLLERGDTVVGVDDMNAYYDVTLKEARLARLRDGRAKGTFELVRADIADRAAVEKVFGSGRFDAVVNLAAQAGVRYSIENPHAYIDANVVGFLNILEGARHHGAGHLVFASTSSVYGLNTELPFREDQNTDRPISLYAATKKANELMAHSYSHLFGIPATGLRFFTVYGPWGRPDMALFKFTRGILAGEAIPVFNEGRMVRDFTYVDDIVEGIVRVIDRPAAFRVFNIGNHQRVELMAYIRAIEKALGKQARLELLPMQAGDVAATEADTSALEAATGFRPATPVEVGVKRFVDWYREYYPRVRRMEAGKLRRLWIAAGWGFVFLVIYLSLTPEPLPAPSVDNFKTGHILAYSWLMLWFAQAYLKLGIRLVVAFALCALGIGLEYAQLLTPHRTFAYSDMVDDAVGVAIGLVLAGTPLGNALARIDSSRRRPTA